MNTIKTLTRYALYTVLCIVFLTFCDYTEETKQTLKRMPEPIILVHKNKLTFWYSVTLKDGNRKTYDFGNASALARSIGENYSINDTIPK